MIIMKKDDIKKQEEKEQVNLFFNTNIGKSFWTENNIINIQDNESPDFLLIKNDETKYALELTQFIVENKNTQYSQALIRYGNNLRRYASENYGINISILIDKYAPVNLVQIGMTILIMLIILVFQKFLKRTP